MAHTDRFQPGDRIEYVCRDQHPGAPTGGWVPATFGGYLPWPRGHVGGPSDMKATVIPLGRGQEGELAVPIGDLRFPPPLPGPVAAPPPPGDSGDVMPPVVNGRLVVSAFRIPPDHGSTVFTWRVILRDCTAEGGGGPWTLAGYTVTRARWVTAAPGIADGEWQDIDEDAGEGFRGLTWQVAELTFARMIKLDAMRPDED
jgi:hypothetical protein